MFLSVCFLGGLRARFLCSLAVELVSKCFKITQYFSTVWTVVSGGSDKRFQELCWQIETKLKVNETNSFPTRIIFPECVARVPVSLWGSGGEAVFAQSCVYGCNRSQPFA